MPSCSPSDPEAAHSNALRLRGGTGHLLAAKTHFWPRCHLPRYDSCTVQIMSVEIPNPQIDKKLHNIVLRKMVHGPCMKKGKCPKMYSRQLISETQKQTHGYPIYPYPDPPLNCT